MANRSIDPAIRAAVEAAVDAAHEHGPVSRADIVAAFAECGIGQATLYRWINDRIKEIAADAVMRKRHPPTPIAEHVQAMAAIGAAAPTRMRGVDYEGRLAASLERSDVMREMGYLNGKPRNLRLVREIDDDERKKLQTLATIQKDLAASMMEKHARFIDELLDIVMAELPEKRDAILDRIEAVRTRYGAPGR